MKNKKKKFIFLLALLFMSTSLGIINVKAENDGDGGAGSDGTPCDSSFTSCWDYIIDGVRITIVDSNGTTKGRSVDYLTPEAYNRLRGKSGWYCTNANRSRVAYVTGITNCVLPRDPFPSGGSTFSSYNIKKISDAPSSLQSHMPIIGNSKAQGLLTAIENLKDSELDTFLNHLGYTTAYASGKDNQYIIVEPLSAIYWLTGKKKYYYGTYAELVKFFENDAGNLTDFQNAYGGLFGKIGMASSIVGNERIKGAGGYKNEAYFNGKLKITSSSQTDTCVFRDGAGNCMEGIKSDYRPISNGWGVGIVWAGNTKIKKPACDYSKNEQWTGELYSIDGTMKNCCEIAVNKMADDSTEEITNYPASMTGEKLIKDHPLCGKSVIKTCTIAPDYEDPNCDQSGKNTGYYSLTITGKRNVSDEWTCIYASPYLDSTLKDYFLRATKKNADGTVACQVFCKEKFSYTYPSNSAGRMTVLAGTYFNITSRNTSYTYNGTTSFLQNGKIYGNANQFTPATLGPIRTAIDRQCRVFGTTPSACTGEFNTALTSFQAPTIEFSYESKYYGNPTEYLQSIVDQAVTTAGNNSHIEFRYAQPDDSFQYVQKGTGISFKDTSLFGSTPYMQFYHYPIHFTDKNKTTHKFQIHLVSFGTINVPGVNEDRAMKALDAMVFYGRTVPTELTFSSESVARQIFGTFAYAKDENENLYYSNAFLSRLETAGVKSSLFDTNCIKNATEYRCRIENNRFYCYDTPGETSNSAATYRKLFDCLDNAITEQRAGARETTDLTHDVPYICKFNVDNTIITIDPPCENDDCYVECDVDAGTCNENGDIKVVYRTIDLTHPFPGTNGSGRNTGQNWCYFDQTDPSISYCNSTNQTVNSIITYNRGAKTDNVYKLDPLYKIVLTPALMKRIRNYNNDTSYDDFNFTCTSRYDSACYNSCISDAGYNEAYKGNHYRATSCKIQCLDPDGDTVYQNSGRNCRSEFIHETFASYFTGCSIDSTGLNCTADEFEEVNEEEENEETPINCLMNCSMMYRAGTADYANCVSGCQNP